MVKKEIFPFRFLLIINILAAVPAFALIVLQPSESKASLLLGFSARKLLMIGIIVLVVIGLIVLDRLYVKRISNVRSWFSHQIQRITANKILIISSAFLSVLLICFLVAISVYILQNPHNPDARLVIKGIGLVSRKGLGIGVYLLFILFSSLAFLGFHASTLFNGLKQLRFLQPLDPNDPLKMAILPLFFTSLLISTGILVLLIQDFIPPIDIAKKLSAIFPPITPQILVSLIWIFLSLGSAYLLLWIMTYLWGFYDRIMIGFFVKSNPAVNWVQNIHPNIRKLVGLFLFIAVGAGFIFFAHPGYGANDDYYMMSIASGKIGGTPEAHLVFSNVIIGSILARLYHWLPGVNWYTWYLVAVLLISLVILVRNVKERSKNGHIHFAFTVALCLFFLTFFWSFTFTNVSIIASFAGLVTLIGEAENKRKKSSNPKLALGIILIFVGGLIRIQGMLLAGVLVGPYLIYLLVKKKKTELLLSLILAGILSGIGFFIDRQAYQSDPGWKFFQAYNTARGSIYGTPRLTNSASDTSFWQAIGWGIEGYQLFSDVVFIDPQVFTLDSLQKINREFAYQYNGLSEILTAVMSTIFANPALILLVITNAVFGIILFCKNKKLVYLLLGMVGWFILVISLLAIFQRIPERITLPAFLILSYGLISLFQSENTGQFWTKKGNGLDFLYLFLICLITLVQVASISARDQKNRDNQRMITGIFKEITPIINRDPKALVVVQAYPVPLEMAFSPFSSSDIPFEFLPTGWLINCPPYQDVLNAHAIGNPIQAFYLNPHVYFLGEAVADITDYLFYKYHVKVAVHEEWIDQSPLYSRVGLVQFSAPPN